MNELTTFLVLSIPTIITIAYLMIIIANRFAGQKYAASIEP